MTYNVHLRLIRERLVGFILVLIELFSLGVMAEALRVNIGTIFATKWRPLSCDWNGAFKKSATGCLPIVSN